jgi:phage shock protein A
MAMLVFGRNRKREMEHRFATFSEQLNHAFAQIKSDLNGIMVRVDSNQRDMEKVYQWIEYLNRHTQRLADNNSKITQKFDKIDENHQKLHTSHRELHTSHTRTAMLAESLENRHQEFQKTVLRHKDAIQEDVESQLLQHKTAAEHEIARLKAWIDYFSTHLDRQKAKEDDLKKDISNVEKGWVEAYSQLKGLLNGIKTENTELKQHVSGVRNELNSAKLELDSAKSEIKAAIVQLEGTKKELADTHKTLDSTNSELENIRNLALSRTSIEKSEVSPPPQPIQQPVQPIMMQPQPIIQQVSPAGFQRHIMARVLPNRKGYVLKFILDLISENKHSTKEIEEIVVNEKQLCGRTSFYAYLKELKLKGRISYAEIDERSVLVNTDAQQRLQ